MLRCVVGSCYAGSLFSYSSLVLLHRYRNFRTFTSPRPVQFACVTLDPGGDVVCAATRDTYEIYMWSMQRGVLLEVRGVVHAEGSVT